MNKKVLGMIIQPIISAVVGALCCLLISYLFAKFGNNLPLSYKTEMLNGPTEYVAFGIKLSNYKELATISFDKLSFLVSVGFLYIVSLIMVSNIIFGKKRK